MFVFIDFQLDCIDSDCVCFDLDLLYLVVLIQGVLKVAAKKVTDFVVNKLRNQQIHIQEIVTEYCHTHSAAKVEGSAFAKNSQMRTFLSALTRNCH